MAKGTRVLAAGVIDTMRSAGAFRVEMFGLSDNFLGKRKITNVVETKRRGEDDITGFRVDCVGEHGAAQLSGYQVANARLVKDVIKADEGHVAGAPGVFFQEDIKSVTDGTVLLNSLMSEGEEFEFPEHIEIVGAVVFKGEDGKPTIPMRQYKGYSQCNAHHQEVNGKDSFMSRDEFAGYLADTTDARIKKLPADLKTLTLGSRVKAMDPANWSFSLLIKDWNEEVAEKPAAE